jgi:UDP-GlcNAc:undecaprenyl-phosphate GlcNAc-1-phosphate transferase
MQLQTSDYAVLFVASILLVGVLTPIVRRIAIKLDVVDSPSEAHKTHKQPVPYLGGVAIIIGVCTVTYTSIFISGVADSLALATTVLLPAVFLGLVGLIDDIKKLAPWPRFIVQNGVGLLITLILIATKTLGSPSGNIVFDAVVTIFWIVGISNAINFFDNVDGGASGAVAIASFFLFFLALQGGQFFIAALSIVLSGATIGFLLWNKPPARIYMGDAGALFLGLLISTLAIRFDPNPIYLSASFAIPILILAVPILDTSVAVLSRIRRGLSPFQGGQDHLSHRLMRSGLSKRQAVISLWLMSLFFSAIAIAISYAPFTLERALVVISLFIWLLLLALFLQTKDEASALNSRKI